MNAELSRPEALREQFAALYGHQARVFRAPGRVNLIGEHTDYNDGFVMPAAIDRYTSVAAAPRNSRRVRLRSESLGESRGFDLDDPAPVSRGDWSDYVRGAAVMLERAGHRLTGADLLVTSEIPIGAGLSSSAALEVSTALALSAIAGHQIDRTALARICQRAENEFVGMRCGIMDQFIACHSRQGHALLLDCRSLEHRLLPLPDRIRLVACNTMVKHELASSAYNRRREECETGVRHFARSRPGVRALRDLASADVEMLRDGLPDDVYRRCRHVVSEDERVEEAAAALECGDVVAFGRLMDDSHRSLRDDYEVSCVELDLMVSLARRIEGVLGARMTGGGFGGCTINLVEADRVDEFQQRISYDYSATTGRTPQVFICSPAAGAEEVVG